MQTEEQFVAPQPGNKIFYIENLTVRWCEYVCLHPRGMGKYHILINASEEPFRLHESRLRAIMHDGFKSYRAAQEELILKHEEAIEFLKNCIKEQQP